MRKDCEKAIRDVGGIPQSTRSTEMHKGTAAADQIWRGRCASRRTHYVFFKLPASALQCWPSQGCQVWLQQPHVFERPERADKF